MAFLRIPTPFRSTVKTQQRTWPISSHLDRTSFIWQSEDFFVVDIVVRFISNKDSTMVLLLAIAVLSVAGTLVDSATNKTNCDFKPNNSSCTQVSCGQPPCKMLCGLTTSYDTCVQSCTSSNCDSLECRASESCLQVCRSTCGSLTCDANNCTQSCDDGTCSSQTCPNNVTTCLQISAAEMTCEADACTQSCSRGECRMICPVGGSNCTQVSVKRASVLVKCDRDVCDQVCNSEGRCNMSCSSTARPGHCVQVCSNGTCQTIACDATNCTQEAKVENATMQCEGDKCVQVSFGVDSTLSCSSGVKTCNQIAYEQNTVMRCDGEECRQTCMKGGCNMICSSSVKECHQVCLKGKCLYKCEAKNCSLNCLPDASCSTPTPPSTTIITTASATIPGTATTLWGALMMALILFM